MTKVEDFASRQLQPTSLDLGTFTGWGKKNGQSTILYYVRGLFFSWHPVEYLKSYLLTISFAKEYYFKLIEPIKITIF